MIDQKRLYSLLGIFIILTVSISFASAAWTDNLNVDLEHYYNFETNSSGLLIDVFNAAGATNGTIVNNVSLVEGGIIGKGYEFDGNNNNHVLMTQGIPGTSGTFSIWSNNTDVSSADFTVFGYDQPARLAGEFTVVHRTNTVYAFDDGTTGFGINGNDTKVNNEWNNIVVLWGTGGVRLYSNGILVATNPSTQAPNFGGDWWISGDVNGADNRGFNGIIDEFGIWSRRLNESEISDLYNNGSGITFSQPPLPPPPQNVSKFENVIVTNNLTVGQNITGLRGFFNYLGGSSFRIVKGWFTDVDVITLTSSIINSGSVNANTVTATGSITSDSVSTNSLNTSSIIVNNKNVCLEDGTNCPADVDTEIKSGSASVTEDDCTPITFNTNFSSVPVAVGSVENVAENNGVSIGSLSVSGFDLCLEKVKGGQPSTYTVYWTATNAGNS